MKPEHTAQRRFAAEVLGRLRSAGFTAYWAGGCVRDELLGLTPKDYDVATNARPEQVRELFGKRQTLAVGEAFGVIVVVGPKEAGTVEVATFRRDATYSDGRRPDAVVFTDAEEDARRRDFTMNALFYDPTAEEVIDFVGGRADIERKLVRAVGDARERFAEDKLRMLRGVRMAATFGFELDDATAAAIRDAAAQVTIVSPERIAQEIRAMFGRTGQARSAELLMTTGLAAAILPEVVPLVDTPSPLADRSAWQFATAILGELDRRDVRSPAIALAALLHQAAEAAETVGKVVRRWRMSSDEREHAVWLVRHHNDVSGAADRPWSAVQPILAHRFAADLVSFVEARDAVLGKSPDDVEFARRRLSLSPAELDPPPLITGDDLVRRGLKPGKEFARLLQAVRKAQLDDEIRTHDDALALVAQLTVND